LDLVDNQVRSLRKRTLIAALQDGSRKGAYWGIRTDIRNYGQPDPLSCPLPTTLELASVPTRLEATADDLQERLMNWGYAVCDAALRAHFPSGPPLQPAFPYARGV
jgi:NTE family protein